MKGQRNAEAGDGNTKRLAKKKRNRPAFKKTLDHPRLRGVPVCIENPSPSRFLVDTGVVIVGICSVRVHPREFLFVSSYRFIRRPVPALAEDAIEPFVGDLQERRPR